MGWRGLEKEGVGEVGYRAENSNTTGLVIPEELQINSKRSFILDCWQSVFLS